MALVMQHKEISSNGIEVNILYNIADGRIYSRVPLEKDTEKNCYKAVRTHTREIMERLSRRIYRNAGIVPNLELYKHPDYDIYCEINLDRLEVLAHASFTAEYLKEIDADIQNRLRESNKLKMKIEQGRQIASELYKEYISRIEEIKSKADIYKNNQLTESDIYELIRDNGYDTAYSIVMEDAELYRIVVDGILYVFKHSAYLGVNGCLRKITVEEFIRKYNNSLYTYNSNTGKYERASKLPSIKTFDSLFFHSNNEYLWLSGFNLPLRVFIMRNDGSISSIDSPIKLIKYDEKNLYDGIDAKGIENIILNRKNKTSEEQNKRRELTEKARKLGIKKSIIGKSEVLLIEILERYKAPDIKEVVEFVNDGPYISYYLSNTAVENNLTAAFDTIRVRFSIGHMEDKPGYRSNFIKQHMKSFNTIVLEVLSNSSKFRQSGAQINLFSCTKSLYKDGLFEYTFTLKKEIYDVLKDNEDDTDGVLTLKHKRC